MRIKSIALSWFRGAGELAVLDIQEKSTVIYGENGAGKSSFVDAIEHVINSGKIGHLSLEQSGKRQEKAVPNTHMPEDRLASFVIRFADNSEHKTTINKEGVIRNTTSETSHIDSWDYRRTILRQDEVARFIQITKGEKYSALLPLLGLQHMEIAAENLRRLAKAVEQTSNLREIKAVLDELLTRRRAVFGDADDVAIFCSVDSLHDEYCSVKKLTRNPIEKYSELNGAIEERISRSSTEQKQHLILKDLGQLDLVGQIASIRSASTKLTAGVEPLISEKLRVLEAADGFGKLVSNGQIQCPACGQEIQSVAFQLHLSEERKRLQEVIAAFEERDRNVGTLCDSLGVIKAQLNRTEFVPWRNQLDAGQMDFLAQLDINLLRRSCTETELKAIETLIVPIVAIAKEAMEDIPPDIQKLNDDKRKGAVAIEILRGKERARLVSGIGILVAFIAAVEDGVREEISAQSARTIGAISADIQDMWRILHPNERIEDVRLHVPAEENKAIDIFLKFHGVDQESPRLTLSEGFRNSLGLCIFLAMAKREAKKDRPIFLDDVVVSVDRNHRGMIVDLLQRLFSDRQLVLFTHDRDWFIELKQQLNPGNWSFKALMPYDMPTVGIRWSEKSYGFDDARKLLEVGPDLAGNTARKVMDIELALVAERLNLRLPYLHRERNDHRGAHDFLKQIIVDGEKAFQKKGVTGYEKSSVDMQILRDADRLLVSWANKASHTNDITKAEATKLIDACESALAVLSCSICKRAISRLHDEKSEFLQCECGNIRWRYGKV